MSKISLKPNASGTGVFSLEAPNSNVDRTLNLPDEAGTVLTNGSDLTGLTGIPNANTPSFQALLGTSQSTSQNTLTKVQLDTVTIDTDSAWDSSNYRFIVPSGKAGNYFINCQGRFNTQSSGQRISLQIFVNGSDEARISNHNSYFTSMVTFYLDALQENDYVEMFMRNSDGNPDIAGDDRYALTQMSIFRVS